MSECDSSRNYLIRMQITTLPRLNINATKMWFITKLLDTNANHNGGVGTSGGRGNVIHHEITWYECKSQPYIQAITSLLNVIHHEITWYECKSQQCLQFPARVRQCDSSRNYLIRMQITTLNPAVAGLGLMWFITKLLDTNANHNRYWISTTTWKNVIHHEITWYECKSQLF